MRIISPKPGNSVEPDRYPETIRHLQYQKGAQFTNFYKEYPFSKMPLHDILRDMGHEAMDFLEILKTRRSIRKFKPDPIPQDVVDRIMDAAIWAPSAMNIQQWKFFVLTDEMRDRLAALHQPLFAEIEDRIRERYGEEGVAMRKELYQNLGGAPVAIVCFGELNDGAGKGHIISLSLASQNLVLAAWAEGIGSLIMTSSMRMSDEIAFLCGVDTKKFEPVMVILLGYPDETPGPKPRRKKRVIYVSKPGDIRGH